MKPRSGRLALLFAIALIGCAVLVMRTGIFGAKQTNYGGGPQRPRRERLDTAALPHTTPTQLTGRAFIRRNIPVLGMAHTIFMDDASGRMQVVASKQLKTDGSYDVKLAENMLGAFAGILIELPGHGFAFLDRETCKQPDVDIQLVFTEVAEVKAGDGKLALLIDDIFPLDVTSLFLKWTPVLQKRLGVTPGMTILRSTSDRKGCFFLTGAGRQTALRQVSGQVTDSKGKPVSAIIAIWMGNRISGPEHLTVSSSADGRFVFSVDAEATVSVSVWDPVHRLVSEPKVITNDAVTLTALPAGIADVLVQEGGSGEPVQGLVFNAERQADMYNGNRKPGSADVFNGTRMTDPTGRARLLLPIGTYSLIVRDTTTKGGVRWELPERRVAIKPGGPAARVQLRATRMRSRNLVPVQGVEPK